MTRRAFTLIELLLAVFILGIGVLGVAALLPSAISMQQRANDDVMGPIVADNAIAIIRSKLTPEMFGTLEEFRYLLPAPTPDGDDEFAAVGVRVSRFPNIPGDWGWKRPATLVSDGNPSPLTARLIGAVDIFGGTAAQGSVPAGLELLAETPDAVGRPGIPYNTWLFRPQPPPVPPPAVPQPPVILITQGERCYPMSSEATYPQPKPQYVWDCMFRRFEGRILVGIFVYRVSTPGGDLAGVGRDVGASIDRGTLPPYRVAPPADLTEGDLAPALPICVNVPAPWLFGGPDGNPATVFDNALIPGTAPTATPAELPIADTWQAPGQWIIDEYNVVHKVASGRRNGREGPVYLVRAIPELEPTPALFGPTAGGGTGANMQTRGTSLIWFVPTRDTNGFILQPVFATVKEL